MKEKVLAIVVSFLICLTTAAFGIAATVDPAYRSDRPPALLINKTEVWANSFTWYGPPEKDGYIPALCGDNGEPWEDLYAYFTTTYQLTVSPGSVLKFSNQPFWFGKRAITVLYYDFNNLLPTKPYWEAEGPPARYTESGQLLAPKAPGLYLASIAVNYGSYIGCITGNGSVHYLVSINVE